MNLFRKNPQTTNTVNGPSVNIVNPVVVPAGALVLIDKIPYRAENYALVEVPFQLIEKETVETV